jgi:hypothetical protein
MGGGGFGMGRGMGAFGPMMPGPMAPGAGPGDERDMLRHQAEVLKQQLDDIRRRISEIEKEEGR